MTGVLLVAVPIGAAIVWLLLAGPARARVVAGFGLAGATVGFIAGAVACVVLLDQGPPDGTGTLVLTWALVAAGIAWIAGAALGATTTREAPSPESRDAWILRAFAGLVVLTGLATVRFLGSTVTQGRAAIGHPGAELRFLPAARFATLADAAIVAVTLMILAGAARGRAVAADGRPVRSAVRRLGTAGLVVGTLAVSATGWVAVATRAGQDDAARTRATARTVNDLLRAAEAYRSKTGEYPGDLTVLTSFGGQIDPGTVVRYAGQFREGSFCVRVGTATADEDGIGPPFYSGIVNADPRTHGHTAQSAWVGDGCHAP